jgi:hypothetical protein
MNGIPINQNSVDSNPPPGIVSINFFHFAVAIILSNNNPSGIDLFKLVESMILNHTVPGKNGFFSPKKAAWIWENLSKDFYSFRKCL